MYGYPWHELPNPFGFAESGTTLEQLAQRLLSKPEESAEVYGRIQNRGMAQVLFRQALLAAYGWRCAFCGLSLEAALQAAHIIPWLRQRPPSAWIPGMACFSARPITLFSMPAF